MEALLAVCGFTGLPDNGPPTADFSALGRQSIGRAYSHIVRGEAAPRTSARGDVTHLRHVRSALARVLSDDVPAQLLDLPLPVLQRPPEHVADRDDADDATVFDHREVTDPPVCHQGHRIAR